MMAFLVGAPLVAVFASAFMDGETRRGETVFRSVLGNDRFEALMAGEGGFPHYLGSNRLAPDFELTDRHGQPSMSSRVFATRSLCMLWSGSLNPMPPG